MSNKIMNIGNNTNTVNLNVTDSLTINDANGHSFKLNIGNNGNNYYPQLTCGEKISKLATSEDILKVTKPISDKVGTNMVHYPFCDSSWVYDKCDVTFNHNGELTSYVKPNQSGVNVYFFSLSLEGYYAINLKAGHTYRLSGCQSGGSETTYRLGLYENYASTSPMIPDFIYSEYGDGITFTPSDNLEVGVAAYIKDVGEFVDTWITFKPMLVELFDETVPEFSCYVPTTADIQRELETKADSNNPVFTGTVTMPAQSVDCSNDGSKEVFADGVYQNKYGNMVNPGPGDNSYFGICDDGTANIKCYYKSGNIVASGTVTGTNITTMQTKVNALKELATASFTSSSVSVAANSTTEYTITPTKSGYTPIGILSVDASSNYIDVMKWALSGGKIYIRVYNNATTAKNSTVTVTVLYTKN